MKSASAATIALLAGNQFYKAELYTITLQTGAVLRYTDADIDLNYNGNVYSSVGPKIVRDRTRMIVGIEVDTMQVTLYAGASDQIMGVPFPQFVRNGGFDGARMRVDCCVMPSYGDTSAGLVNIFTGTVLDARPSRTEIALSVGSDMQLLNIPMPRNVYSTTCPYKVYDAACGAIKANFGTSSACGSGSDTLTLNCQITQVAGWFDTGPLTFTSGQNAGATRTIKHSAPGVLTLALPLPFVPAVGDTFVAYAGCDGTLPTCESKFNRRASFRGCPFIPVPEASL